MDQRNRNLYSYGSLALLAVVFVALVMLSNLLFRGVRLDLTENRQFTLSEGTRSILATLQEPVNLYLFFSEQASRDLPQIRNYARQVEELLGEMADRGGGGLRVQRIDPRPFSPEEDQAAQFGLQAVPVGSGDVLYFGLAGTNSLDDVQVMPFLQPSKEQFLEYDLAKMIATLTRPEQKRVGLLSSLDMQPGFDPATQGFREGWVIYQQLDQLFDLQVIQSGAEALPPDLDLLFLVHPKNLEPGMRYEIDQFVLRGGRLAAFMDPFAESDQGANPGDPMAQLSAGSGSTLGDLLEAWGVAFSTAEAIGDLQYALQVSRGAGSLPVRHIGMLAIPREGLNDEDIVSADLEAVNLSSSGWLEPADDATTAFEPLLSTSQNAAPIDAGRLRFLTDPQELMTDFQPTGDRYTLAARVHGRARSAYEEPPEGRAIEAHRAESGEEGIQVILFADTDILTDRFWVQKQNFLGQTLVNSFADNGTLVVNAVDHLLGSSDLISIRTRTTSSRPFQRVERLRLEAENRFRATEQRLQVELDETERKLAAMQNARTEADLAVLSADQQAEIQRFMDQRLQIRRDLRQVRHELDRDIDALGSRLKIINIALGPMLILVAALAYGQLRRRRQAGGAT